MSEVHYIIISAALVISLILSHAYAQVLKPLQRVYLLDWIDIPVIIGEFLILATLAALEYGFSITLSTPLIAAIMAAWGIPIEIWQHNERMERQRRKRQDEQEETIHGKAARSRGSP